MRTILKPCILGTLLSLMLWWSCATQHSFRHTLPADVTFNKDAGRGCLIIVTLQLDGGEKLPFVLDTASPWTLFDTSLEPKLGKRLSTTTMWNFGVKQESGVYAAPKLYLGSTRLMMTRTNIPTIDLKQASSRGANPFVGVLGMDCLEHYCIQLDFASCKMRFLDAEHANKKGWGKPFSLTDIGDGCFCVSETLVGLKGVGSLIDTGCDHYGWLTPQLFEYWTDHAMLPEGGQVRSPNGVLGGNTYSNVDLHGLDAKVLLSGDSHTRLNGIGLRFLARHLVTLDFPNRTIYLKRTSF